MGEYGTWSEDQNGILQVFTNEFCKFKRNLNITPHQLFQYLETFLLLIMNG